MCANRSQVVGLDCSASFRDGDVWAMIESNALATRLAFPGSIIVVITEANMGYTGADRVATLFRRPTMRPSHIVVRDETGRNRPGVWTSETHKVSQNKAHLTPP